MWNPYNTNQFIPNFSPYYNSPTPTPSSYGYREPMMYTDRSDEMLHGAEEHRR